MISPIPLQRPRYGQKFCYFCPWVESSDAAFAPGENLVMTVPSLLLTFICLHHMYSDSQCGLLLGLVTDLSIPGALYFGSIVSSALDLPTSMRSTAFV